MGRQIKFGNSIIQVEIWNIFLGVNLFYDCHSAVIESVYIDFFPCVNEVFLEQRLLLFGTNGGEWMVITAHRERPQLADQIAEMNAATRQER